MENISIVLCPNKIDPYLEYFIPIIDNKPFLIPLLVNRLMFREDYYHKNIFPKKIYEDTVLIFRNAFDCNSRHFMTETFSIVKFFDSTNYKILTSINCPKHISDIIKLYNLEDRVIFLDTESEIICKKIILPEPNYYPIIDNLFIEKCILKSPINLSKKIYLSREKYDNHEIKKRYPTNYKILYNYLIKNNYHIIDLEDYAFYEQVSIINNATEILTLIGAGCENILFTNTNCTFSIIYPNFCEVWINQYKKYKIKGKLNTICCGILDKTIDRSKMIQQNDPSNGPYIIDMDILHSNLELVQ